MKFLAPAWVPTLPTGRRMYWQQSSPSRHWPDGTRTGHSAQDMLRYLVNLTHLLVQQQRNPNRIRARCQFILIVALPSFFFHGQEDLRKGIDTEGRVLEPLE